MTERDVERAVISFFQSDGYLCLPANNGLKAWDRKYSFREDGKEWQPDVVAFKWDADECMMDIRVVECKDGVKSA